MGPRLGNPQVSQDMTCPEAFWEVGSHTGESTYLAGLIGKVNLQIAHGFDNGHDGLDGVAIDDCAVLPAFLLGVAVLLDDPGGQGSGVSVHRP